MADITGNIQGGVGFLSNLAGGVSGFVSWCVENIGFQELAFLGVILGLIVLWVNQHKLEEKKRQRHYYA